MSTGAATSVDWSSTFQNLTYTIPLMQKENLSQTPYSTEKMPTGGRSTGEREVQSTFKPTKIMKTDQTPNLPEQVFFITKSDYNKSRGSVNFVFIARNHVKTLSVEHQYATSFLDRFGQIYALGQTESGRYYCEKVTSRIRDNGERVFTTNPMNPDDDRLKCLSVFKGQQPVRVKSVEEFNEIVREFKIGYSLDSRIAKIASGTR